MTRSEPGGTAPAPPQRRKYLESMRDIHGVETYFPAPASAPASPPPKWKMAIVGFTAIYPLVLLVPPLVAPLLPPGPRWLQILIQMMFITPLMTWVALPLATNVFKGWLKPASKAASPSDRG